MLRCKPFCDRGCWGGYIILSFTKSSEDLLSRLLGIDLGGLRTSGRGHRNQYNTTCDFPRASFDSLYHL